MRVFIRTDSSNLIGSGHVVRCLVLAQLLKNSLCTVTFICRDLPNNCYQLILEKGYDLILLPFPSNEKKKYALKQSTDDYLDRFGVSIYQDAQETTSTIINKNCDLLICDNYAIDCKWEELLYKYTKKIMVIDDLANRKHFCDILLDHNFYQNLKHRYEELVPLQCKLLLGPKYALINPKLIKTRMLRLKKIRPDKLLRNVLVFLGGVDIDNYTDLVLQQLGQSNLKVCNVIVVLGRNNPHIQNLRIKHRSKNISFLIQPNNYYELMVNADFSISAAGVSLLERLYINLPSIVLNVAKNQKEICEHASKSEIAIYVTDINKLKNKLNELSVDVLSKLTKNINKICHSKLLSVEDIINENCI